MTDDRALALPLKAEMKNSFRNCLRERSPI